MQLTSHALSQITRRRIRDEDIYLAIDLGREIHAAGATFYVLGLRDIPSSLRCDPDVRRAEGTTVVVEFGRITTVYKNRRIGHLKRKPRHRRIRVAA